MHQVSVSVSLFRYVSSHALARGLRTSGDDAVDNAQQVFDKLPTSRPAHWRLRPVIASATDAHCYYIKIRRQQNTVALAKQVRQTLRQYVLLEITVICSRS
ncbi:hypothetical protein BS78_08G121300 [Paspalum vaginatum]|nr:hypothetical protein BS78_08G121300 [Paspalum vaginatum]